MIRVIVKFFVRIFTLILFRVQTYGQENKEKGKVINSFETFKRLWKILVEANEKGEEIWLTIQS